LVGYSVHQHHQWEEWHSKEEHLKVLKWLMHKGHSPISWSFCNDHTHKHQQHMIASQMDTLADKEYKEEKRHQANTYSSMVHIVSHDGIVQSVDNALDSPKGARCDASVNQLAGVQRGTAFLSNALYMCHQGVPRHMSMLCHQQQTN
jgi:hypothetical protein